ncbi:MAG TPA: flagellar biosynthesis anti-sigma factor FlgM [Buttiauxella sp.]|jgi:negative regulator of flagellin synthesis FlgM
MSIDRTTPAAPVNSIAATQEMRTRPQNQDAGQPQITGAADDKTQVRLSSLTQQIKTDSSRDVDYERVAALRTALQAGELPIEPEKIARALVQDIFQFS